MYAYGHPANAPILADNPDRLGKWVVLLCASVIFSGHFAKIVVGAIIEAGCIFAGCSGMEESAFNLENFVGETVREFRSVDVRLARIEAVLPTFATKADLADLRTDLKSEMVGLRTELKSEMADLKSEMAGLRTELKSEMADSRAEFKSEMAGLRTDFKSEMAGLRTEFKSEMLKTKTSFVQWVAGFALVVITIVVACSAIVVSVLK